MGITRQQALDACKSDDLIGIGMEADAVRRALHPENVVTYVINRTICCADGALDARFAEAVELNASGVTLRDLPPGTSLAELEGLLSSLRSRFPALWIHGFSATETCA